MKRWNRAVKWLIPIALAAGVIFLSWGLQWMVPDYKNKIRTVEYDSNAMVSIAEQEDEIELYPWNLFREENCVSLYELEAEGVMIPGDGEAFLYNAVWFFDKLGYISDYDQAMEQLTKYMLYDGTQGRIYIKDLPVVFGEEKCTLNLAWSWAGIEYLEVSGEEKHTLSSEDSESVKQELQEMLEEFRQSRYGGSEELSDAYAAYPDYLNGAEDTAIEEKDRWEVVANSDEAGAFQEFFELMAQLGEMNGTDTMYLLDTAVYSYPCEMIPYQGKFLLVFSGEKEGLEVILIYDPVWGRISGCSLRY